MKNNSSFSHIFEKLFFYSVELVRPYLLTKFEQNWSTFAGIIAKSVETITRKMKNNRNNRILIFSKKNPDVLDKGHSPTPTDQI